MWEDWVGTVEKLRGRISMQGPTLLLLAIRRIWNWICQVKEFEEENLSRWRQLQATRDLFV